VYRYFRSKEEIIEAMCAAGQQQSAALIQGAQRHDGTRQVLDQLADAFFPMVLEPTAFFENHLFLQVWAEGLRNERIRAMLQERLASIRAPFAQIIRQGQRRGEIVRSLDPDAVARILMSLYQGLVVQTALGTQPNVRAYTAAAKALVSGLFIQRKPVRSKGLRSGAPHGALRVPPERRPQPARIRPRARPGRRRPHATASA
jgi:AcrR family transcriptional regulator